MVLHAVLFVVHILSAVIWLSIFPAALLFNNFMNKYKGNPGDKKLMLFFIKLTSTFGMIGMSGILLTGIIMVSILPYYSFFDFSTNHWLATKQVIMVILIVLVFTLLIPRAKKITTELTGNLESNGELQPHFFENIKKMKKIGITANILVLVNFLLAITHRFFTI
jgi:hypothetical protein